MNSYDEAVATASRKGYDALDLYVYNMALASALLGPLHILEIVTRNAMHELLADRAERRDWWRSPTIAGELDSWGSSQIDGARSKVVNERRRKRDSSPVTPDDVVAATEFGFWTALLQPAYETTLWQHPVRHAFPNSRRTRQQMYQAIQSHRRLRNRVTHHEPLHAQDAVAAYEKIVQFIGFVSIPVARWVDDRSRLATVARGKPGRGGAPVSHF